jgi:UDP-N-acetylmuramoyl-tripeptide--D-alanyl-D-alanine ligase
MSVKQLYDLFLESAGVTTDSRIAAHGNIFFALGGENYDGHAFAEQALRDGCSLAVIDKSDFTIPGKTILVENVLDSLQQLACYHRQRFEIPVVAVTGSNGKTTTKELMREVLSVKYKTLATHGNLNNHIGVPLTLLDLKGYHQIAIIEMGANHTGEIDLLCRIAGPTHGLITNAGLAHLEGFGSPEGVLKAKGELFEYLKKTGGKIFLNYDRPNLRNLVRDLEAECVSFGSGKGHFVSGTLQASTDRLKMSVRGQSSGHLFNLETQLAGDYNFENVLAAVCTGTWFGVSPEEIKTAVEGYVPGNNRSQILETSSNTLLLDAYNANPDSMKAAIINFSVMPGKNKSVILGDMLELGEYAAGEHNKIIELLKVKGFRQVLLVGDMFCKSSATAGYLRFRNVDGLINWLKNNPLSDRFILLKGSRGIQLEKCITNL